jgi:hypothetical protein
VDILPLLSSEIFANFLLGLYVHFFQLLKIRNNRMNHEENLRLKILTSMLPEI